MTAALIMIAGAGCDDELPHDKGVWHLCNASVIYDGVPPMPTFNTRICANLGLPFNDLNEACVSQCEDDHAYFCVGLGIDDEGGDFELFFCDPDCINQGVTPTSESCANASIVPGPPPLGQASVALSSSSTASVSVQGEGSGPITPSGSLHYSSVSCAAPPCLFQLAAFRFTTPTFEIDGHPISSAIVQSAGLAEGTVDGAGNYTIPAGALRVSTNFTVDGDAASITLANSSAVTGRADPANDSFTVNGTFAQDDVSVTLALVGTHTNLPPTAAFTPTGDVECTSPDGADVSLDASSSTDPEGFGDLIAFRWRVGDTLVGAGNPLAHSLPFGPSEVGVGVVDSSFGRDIAVQTLTVVDTTAPVVTAPPDATVECEAPTGTAVALGAATASDVCDDTVPVTNDAPSVFALGATTVTWSATDDAGNTGTDAQSIVVEDTTPPELVVSLSPNVLWAPNHSLVRIRATVVVTDVCDAAPAVQLVSITSDEPDNGLGDGDAPGDIQLASFGTDDRAFALRAERAGTGDGRVYTVTYEASDASGNTARTSATVTVPVGLAP